MILLAVWRGRYGWGNPRERVLREARGHLFPTPPPMSRLPITPSRMYAPEFRALANVGKTRYFEIIGDPEIRSRLDVQKDASGRSHMDRDRALRLIAQLQRAPRDERSCNLGVYARPGAPRRGRSCPTCGQRNPRRATACRHCGAPLAPPSETRS